MRTSKSLTVPSDDVSALERLVRTPSTAQKVVLRARIVLLSASRQSTMWIADELATSVRTITRWRTRYESGGLAALLADAPRAGRPKTLDQEAVEAIIKRTLEEKPAGSTHWSTRTMAAAAGVSQATVHRIWRAHGLKPHRVKRFKLSNDPQFVEKLQDVVGLYLNPPEKAIVFCVDEKSQIQALDRTQPGLPMKKGRAGTMTHDYKRNGTTTLFAGLNVATGTVTGECMGRHRHDEFLLFLRKLDRQVPKGTDMEVILDNYGTHKHWKVEAWLLRHPRVHLHFIPTSSSWLNLVERFFAEITDKAIRRGVFKNVDELVKTIEHYLAIRNADPHPYTWTASTEAILAKVARARTALPKAISTSDSLH